MQQKLPLITVHYYFLFNKRITTDFVENYQTQSIITYNLIELKVHVFKIPNCIYVYVFINAN
jgi:hypothetical protein